MRAVRFHAEGRPPAVLEVPRPRPTGEQVLLRVVAAGLCHTDVFFMSAPPERRPFDLPLTLGHECVGVVAETGPDAPPLDRDRPMALFGAWGCGHCPPCTRGAENYCVRAAAAGIRPPGLGADGALADYVLVDHARHLVPVDGLDPVAAVALTDAALTPYHALRDQLPRLRPGATVVVLGVGGLGHVAVQLLGALSAARIVAVDVRPGQLELARRLGVHHAVTPEAAADTVRALTDAVGADVVFDFAGTEQTTALAAAVSRVDGSVVVVGAGGGHVPIAIGRTPYGLTARSTYWGGLHELREVIELARTGAIRIETEVHSLDEAPAAYERLAAGLVAGRAVVVP